MATGSTSDENQTAVVSRQHTRVQSSGNQSSTSQLQTTTLPFPSNQSSTSTPTASTMTLPRASSNMPASSTTTTASGHSSRTISSGSPRRSSVASTPSNGQVSTSASRSSLLATPSSSSALSSRREAFGSSVYSNTSAASYLSSQQGSSSAPSGSLFGFLGASRQATDDSSVNHPYGWRAMSASNNGPSTTSATTSAAPSTANPVPASAYNVHRSHTPATNFHARPAITSFLANPQAGHGSWNGQPNRSQQQQQQQQQQNIQAGSPARNHAIVSGTSSPWLGTPQGHNVVTGSTSGWTLADPAAWGGWASAGRLCSGFEENQVVSFTWLIPEAHLLRDEVEKSPLPSEEGRSISAGAGKSEVWTTQPIFGDGKWKLELVRTSRPSDGDSNLVAEGDATTQEVEEEQTLVTKKTTVLSVYLTSMVLDYSAADLEIPARVMIGIKPVQSQARASRTGSWIWQEFVHFVFRRENEYYECHQLPSLSELLQDRDIERQDAFSLTIQISTGPRAAAKSSEQSFGCSSDSIQASPFIVQDNQLVHHSLMNGLERLLDCSSTGDVVLIVRERGILRRQSTSQGGEDVQEEVWTRPVGTPMFDWAKSQEDCQVVVRDRLLWAHSSILGARSEFFNDMLQSHFAEGQEQNLSTGEMTHGDVFQIQGRKVRTLRIFDADFTTIYWFLRYLYLEEVEFVPGEDVRCAALDDEWMTIGQSAADNSRQTAVWQWTPLDQLEAAMEGHQGNVEPEIQPTRSFATLHGRSVSKHRHGSASVPLSPDTTSHLSYQDPSSPNRSKGNSSHELCNGYQRRAGSDHEARHSVRASFAQESSMPDGIACPTTTMKGRPLLSLHQSLFMDPHIHPCEKPSPASALALYRLAHLYHQVGLVRLAKNQLIGSLTPQNAFPTLLATNLYADLYEHVKVYVLEKWDQVSQTSDFEQCCDEVSAGEWGVEAGRTLRLFMQSLLSPNRAR